jgi:hypothetical protein
MFANAEKSSLQKATVTKDDHYGKDEDKSGWI